jgi:hypothetical protein
MDKLDFPSFLESTGHEFQARILKFSIDEPKRLGSRPKRTGKAAKRLNAAHRSRGSQSQFSVGQDQWVREIIRANYYPRASSASYCRL